MGKVVARERCPECEKEGHDSTGDNLARYDDGSGFCFRCRFLDPGPAGGGRAGLVVREEGLEWDPVTGHYEDLPERGISEAICRLYRYQVAEVRGVRLEVANYYDQDGKLQGQKFRGPNKTFACKGNMKDPGLFGEHLWKRGGRRLVITEGEIDCLAVAQLLDGRWPVVSIPNGAAGAAAAIKRSFEFVNSYDEVLLCFDMDDAGRKAAIECAEVLTPGKAKIVTLPRKDAADMMAAGESRQLSTALWEAKEYCPSGILSAAEVFARPVPKRKVHPFPWREMNQKMYGVAEGTVTMITSGTGMGKSTFVRALVHDHLQNGHKVGMLMLEESPIETLHELMSFESGIPINRIMTGRALNESLVQRGQATVDFDVVDNLSDEAYEKLKARILEKNNLYLYDTDGVHKNIVARIEHMAQALGCSVIVLDHISLVIAMMGEGESERKGIDRLLAELRGIVDRTGIALLVVSQLRKGDGQPYEEGGRVTLQDLRGSGMLSMVPNTVIAVERNQQHPSERERNTLLVRSLKHRLSGYTGPVMGLFWNTAEHRFEPVPYNYDEEGKVTFVGTNHLNAQEIPE